VTVAPQIGSGEFTLTVSYSIEGLSTEGILCSYEGPEHSSIGNKIFPQAEDLGFVERSQSMTFTVTKPGIYTVHCDTKEMEEGTAFEVVEMPTEPPVSIATEPPPPPPPVQPVTTNGTFTMEFDHNKDTFSSNIHNHGIMDYLHEMCAPSKLKAKNMM
jgi:hypothetical protein